MPSRRIPVPNDDQTPSDHELVVYWPSTGARWPSEFLLRGSDGRLGRITTSLLLQAARRDYLLPADHAPEEAVGGDAFGDAEWADVRNRLLGCYLGAPHSRPAEFESHIVEQLLVQLGAITMRLEETRRELVAREDPGTLAEVAIQQAENNETADASWGGLIFTESARTGLRVARDRQRFYIMLRMKGAEQTTRVFGSDRIEYRVKNKKPTPWRSKKKEGDSKTRWPIRGTTETRPREVAAAIAAFTARCNNANATEAYTECANTLGIKGDLSPEAVYKAMRRLVTTLRKPEFHNELRFLAAPGIDVDLLIKTVLDSNFRELS